MAADSERRQRRVGTVVSNRSDKTIAVRVEAVRRHPIYRKPVRIRRKLLAHDAENTCEVGDVVEITASRPYSRRKRWRLTRIVIRATLTEEEQAAVAAASAAAQAAGVEPAEDVDTAADPSPDTAADPPPDAVADPPPDAAAAPSDAAADLPSDAAADLPSDAAADLPSDAAADPPPDAAADASESEGR